MNHLEQVLARVLLVLCLCGFSVQGGRLYMDKCDETRGFSCIKSTQVSGRFEVVFFCNPRTTWDVEFYLWSFRAIAQINSFTIANCTNVTLHLQCTNELRNIQSLRITNVTNLNIPSPLHGLSQPPAEVILEDIQNLETIFSRTFIQVKKYHYRGYGCAHPYKDLESVTFKNININTIQREAFHNLTYFKNFTFDNVTVDKMESTAVQVFLDKNSEVRVARSRINLMEFMAFHIRGSKFFFVSNIVKEIYSTAIKSTIHEFNFHNNTFGWVHCGAMSILAHTVRISDSSFDYLAAGAFQTIGPGLPENALQGFGDLDFSYDFKNNLVESLEVGSLHPDWRAYKKVGGHVTFTYNALKCSCAELAWLGHKEGFGRDYSTLDGFHEIVLDKENKNICVDSPCFLPVDAVKLMRLKDGRCMHNLTQSELCNLYNPTTTTTRKTAVRPVTTTPYLQYLKKSRFSKAGSSKLIQSFLIINFMLILIKLFG